MPRPEAPAGESRRRDSNPRPIAYKAIALPAELLRRNLNGTAIQRTHPQAVRFDCQNRQHGTPKGGRTQLARVQCKSGRLNAGAVRFATCSSYAHHPNPRAVRRDYLGEIDYFAVYCRQTARVYLVPIGEAPVRRQAALRVEPARNSQRRRIRLAADYEVGRISLGERRECPGEQGVLSQ
jgi:PD-(D/E)XK endonuclease